MPPWLLFALAPMVIAAASVLLERLPKAAWLAIVACIAMAEAIFMASAFTAGRILGLSDMLLPPCQRPCSSPGPELYFTCISRALRGERS
jgi:hypothetical protein